MIGRDLVRADAAVTINGLVRWTITHGCGGLEAWAGTPGRSAGRFTATRTGASANIGDLVESVRLAGPDGTLRQVSADRLEFAYDTSRLQRPARSCCGRRSASARAARPRRCGRWPVSRWPSASAPSRWPRRAPAASSRTRSPAATWFPRACPPRPARSIDRAGLKDQRIGGARVSPTHGNFIVNDGSATAADIAALAMRCRDAVRERFGVTLREEIVRLGDWSSPAPEP